MFVVAALLDELVAKGHRTLVSSQSGVTLDILRVCGYSNALNAGLGHPMHPLGYAHHGRAASPCRLLTVRMCMLGQRAL